ncbi:hypothetical protein [Streptomyces sp. NPDC101150]|uniref:hypothetical protein n=1 Tax=Streptomyces sp. NPDC101150 TaxID=3366114 RepID=UPI00382EFD8C
MRRTTTVASASAAVMCLGVLLTGCGSAAPGSYVALGAAGPADGRAPTKAVPPEDRVELTPLDGDRDGRRAGHGGAGTDSPRGRPSSAAPSGTGADDTAPGDSPGTAGGAGGTTPDAPVPTSPTSPGSSTAPGSPGSGSGSGTGDGSGDGGTSPAPEPPSPTIPAGPGAPAGLLIGKPGLADTDVRWCEKVSVDFLNTGKHAVTDGTVTFGTHVIGALGVDWSTIDSTHKLPLPLAPGEKKRGTWRVCVDAWRVPLGMHIDTKDATFHWD